MNSIVPRMERLACLVESLRSTTLTPGLVFVMGLLVLAAVASAQAQPRRFKGASLAAALQALAADGVPVVFTDFLVRPEMRIRREPRASEPRRLLEELLSPHGLTIRETVAGRWVVVPAPERPPMQVALAISVVDRASREPLTEAEIRVIRTSDSDITAPKTVVSDARGKARIDLAADVYRVEVQAPRYVAWKGELSLTSDLTEVRVELVEIPRAVEQIEVVSNRPRLLAEAPSTLVLGERAILALPSLGEDVLRGLTLLPGATSSGDRSADFHVRGGRPDEVLVKVDGLEIVEPYHLQDFDNAFSILAPKTIGRVELQTGGFTVEHGDRMSGLLDLTTIDPIWRRQTDLGLSVWNARASSSGQARGRAGRWLASLRAGSFELPLRLADEEENPSFWDAHGKIEPRLSPSLSLRASVLAARDELDFSQLEEEELESFRTSYNNAYLWATAQQLLGRRLFFETRTSYTHVERDRRGTEDRNEGRVALRDERELRVAALSQDWNLRLGDRQLLRWGFDWRQLDMGYDYFNERALDDPLAAIRFLPAVGSTVFTGSFRGRQIGLYVTDRLEIGALGNVELGLRFDDSTITDDDTLSPRLVSSWTIGRHSRLRIALGHYAQSQRFYELQVEDGETNFLPAEVAEQWIVGFDHDFAHLGERHRRRLSLRAEIYGRHIADPRPRFENLFEPRDLIPELAADRVRLAPRSSRAEGFELLLVGTVGRRLDGSLSYAYAEVTDRIGDRDVPRGFDQRHSVGLQLHLRLPWKLLLDLGWRHHSGRPTTRISGRAVPRPDGTLAVQPVLGPLYGERLPSYQRLDLRLARVWPGARGDWRVFLEVQNVTNAPNIRGFDVELELTDDGQVEVVTEATSWGGPLPSLGVSWSF